MPVQVTYPGVYVEEIPSGVRTIAGVSTSIAAFVGWAAKGPIDSAGLVLGFADYSRDYGGLDGRSPLGYAVSHFFSNGGQQAYIVRLVARDAAAATLTLAPLTVTARSPGAWANDYGIVVEAEPGGTKRLRLQVAYVHPGSKIEVPVESFENVSIVNPDPQGRYVADVVGRDSRLVRVAVVPGAGGPPADTPVPTAANPTPSPKLAGGADGTVLDVNTGAFESALAPSSGMGGVFLLRDVDLFNLLCVPGETTSAMLATLAAFCRERRAFLIADSAADASFATLQNGPDPALSEDDGINAAFYFPWVNAPDPLQANRPRAQPPSGFVAGVYARSDATRGVWKAPAGMDASLTGATGLTVSLNDAENGVLNPRAVNCLRDFPVYGTVVWGARTLRGHDATASQWKYVPVRRLALFIEESLYRGLKWVVFEPNAEPLWAEIRLNVGAFMQNLFRQGAFTGATPRDAYFVKCDAETTTQGDRDLGIVKVVVGFAPLKPAEFVVIQIQRMTDPVEKPAGNGMTEVTVDAPRFDPYASFEFRVKWDGRQVAGFGQASLPKHVVEVGKHHGDPGSRRHLSDPTKFDAVTLERGVTYDKGFEEWANSASADPPCRPRKDILLEVYDESGRLTLTYAIHGCWVSEYQAPALDAKANAVAIQHLKLEHEGWERGPGVSETGDPPA